MLNMLNQLNTRLSLRRGWVLPFLNSSKKRNTIPRYILSMALISSLIVAVPMLYILYQALISDKEVWMRVLRQRIPSLTMSTFTLMFSVTALGLIIAVPMAWFTNRTDLPFRRVLRWLAVVPLMIPPYIGVFVYITIFGPRGTFVKFLAQILDKPIHTMVIPSIYSFGGATILLALFTYPYIYLMVSSGLKNFNSSFEDAARVSGLSPIKTFTRVVLPMLRPSIAAGALMVAMYVLSDFGAISMLRYNSFTSAIHLQLVGRYDRAAASILSAVLAVMAILLVYMESKSREKLKYTESKGASRKPELIKMGKVKWIVLFFIIIILFFAMMLPLGMIIYWAIQTVIISGMPRNFMSYVWNSVIVSSGAATLSVFIAFPIAYLGNRQKTWITKLMHRLSFIGYTVPGVVVALGMIFVANRFIPSIYRTVWIVMLALIIRYMPKCIQSEDASLCQVPYSVEEAARLCGYSPTSTLRKVVMPLIAPGIISGWVLVFINSMKELPATLLLRPPGFDTLAIRIWIDASEGMYTQAGPAALILVLISAIPVAMLIDKSLGRE